MVEHLGQQLTALVEELRTVADPDAAEAQIEFVTTEAAELSAVRSPEHPGASRGDSAARASRDRAHTAGGNGA